MKEKISALWDKAVKGSMKYSSCALGLVAIMTATIASSRCCCFCLHQPEVPAEVKKYRKF